MVVGAALIGGQASPAGGGVVALASAPTRGAPGSAQPVAVLHGRSPGPGPHLIVLESPTTPLEVVTTRDLVVRGHLASGTGPVLVALESSRGTTIVGRTVGPMTMPRPGYDPSPPFEVRLVLPEPRPIGTMTIEVVAYDIAGIPVDAIRRVIRIGGVAADEPFPRR